MIAKSVVTIFGKRPPGSFTGQDGQPHAYFQLNIGQDNGAVVDTITVPEAVYNEVEPGSVYALDIDFGRSAAGKYFKVLGCAKMK